MPDRTEHDHVHVDADEADAIVDADRDELLPPPAIREPVAVGAGVSVAAVVGALIAADVPWYGAVGLAALLVLVAAWQRHNVTPSR